MDSRNWTFHCKRGKPTKDTRTSQWFCIETLALCAKRFWLKSEGQCFDIAALTWLQVSVWPPVSRWVCTVSNCHSRALGSNPVTGSTLCSQLILFNVREGSRLFSYVCECVMLSFHKFIFVVIYILDSPSLFTVWLVRWCEGCTSEIPAPGMAVEISTSKVTHCSYAAMPISWFPLCVSLLVCLCTSLPISNFIFRLWHSGGGTG